MSPEIEVKNLERVYRVSLRSPGLWSTISSLFKTTYQNIYAVKGINFEIQKGEVVGFIGPNGAGKTTTLKMLSGLLLPSGGSICVQGYQPWERKTKFLRQISMIMGNKSQLTWENTVLDSMYILKEIYHVSNIDFKQRLDELVDMLEIRELLPRLIRNLSLGERAKCEFAAALIHQPDILFLDEPTLGLDVTMQLRLRNFIQRYNQKYETTIIVTSHYMADILSLCSRVILIHQGKLLFDGRLTDLARQIAPFKLIRMTIQDDSMQIQNDFITNLHPSVVVLEKTDRTLLIRVKKEALLTITTNLMKHFTLVDLTIEDPAIDVVIDQVYREGVIA